jgi:hypothetical protein
MTRLLGLEDIEKALHVRYSESPEPQTVKVRLKLKGKSEFRTQGWYPIFFDTIVNCAAWGMVGSNVFEPKAAKASVVSGPKRASKDVGPVFEWEIKVTAAAAPWIRLFVEHLAYRYNDTPQLVTELSIVGSYTGKHVVTEGQVIEWLDGWGDEGPGSFRAWPAPPFALREQSSHRVGAIEAAMEAKIDKRVRDWLTKYLGGVGSMVFAHPSRDLTKKGTLQAFPQMTVAGDKLAATWDPFDTNVALIRPVLINAMVAMHQRIAPIRSVSLLLPDE